MPNGEVWKNIVTEEKAKPAETLAEFRGNYKYNLLDKNRARLQCRSPDVRAVGRSRGHQQLVAGRAADARRAPAQEICREERPAAGGARQPRLSRVHADAPNPAEPGRVYRKISYGPLLDVFMLDMRSYRGPNGEDWKRHMGRTPISSGPAQVAWLKRELMNSQATWKVIAADMPIGLIVVYDTDRKWGSRRSPRATARRAAASLRSPTSSRFIKRAGIRNTLWLTADVHYTAAHYYDPNKAAFQDFEPFWEFVSGPIHAGSFPQNQLDDTFGPQLVYVKAPRARRTCRRVTACNSSVTSRSTEERNS